MNRDELRRMLHGGLVGGGWAEQRVTIAQRAQIEALLRAGINVICDDTNLNVRVARGLAELGRACGAEVRVRDFLDVDVDECIARDAARPEPERVGAAAILAMHRRYLAGRVSLPSPETIEAAPAPYLPPDGAPEAILVDLDGTVAMLGDRDPYDESQLSLDKPNTPVITVVRALAAAGFRIVYCSGRTEASREDTVSWLDTHVGVDYDALYLRRSGDHRRDSTVKREIFDEHLRHSYRIVMVLDDRNHVVRMWRSLGLTVLQVADGDF